MPKLTKLLASVSLAVGLVTGAAAAQTTETAQTAPPARTAPPTRTGQPGAPPVSAQLSLQMAYRAIGEAEARGATGRYLDGARNHYRSAIARFGRDEAPAAAREAMAAAALARAAIDERPVAAPRDIPAPPPLAANAMRPPSPRRGFDPEALRRYATLQNTPEANDLARNALEAAIARDRALFAGNRDEGLRQGRLARDLASAVRMLAIADHPEAAPQPRQMRRPMSPPGSFGPPPTRAVVDGTVPEAAEPVVLGFEDEADSF